MPTERMEEVEVARCPDCGGVQGSDVGDGEWAGVPHIRNRGAHGFRRMIAGDLVDATGSNAHAMEAIGDRSVKMAETYVLRRRGRKAQAMKALDKGVA